MLWMSQHGLSGNVLERLELLVRFCINVYFKLYFDIKVKHHIKDAPNHLISTLKLLRQQSEEVRKIITDVIRGAYSAHSENLLASFICSDVQEQRKFAVDEILRIRNGREKGDSSVRLRKNPSIVLTAETPMDLIDWKKENVMEPIFTVNMSVDSIKKLVEVPLTLESYSTHTPYSVLCKKLVKHLKLFTVKTNEMAG